LFDKEFTHLDFFLVLGTAGMCFKISFLLSFTDVKTMHIFSFCLIFVSASFEAWHLSFKVIAEWHNNVQMYIQYFVTILGTKMSQKFCSGFHSTVWQFLQSPEHYAY